MTQMTEMVSDPYLIYSFLHHHVEVQDGRRKIKGLVEKVCRNIFEDAIELTMEGKTESFKEPERIMSNGDKEVSFVYGCGGVDELTDEELFEEVRENSRYGETVDDILDRKVMIATKTTRIVVGKKGEVQKPKKKRKG